MFVLVSHELPHLEKNIYFIQKLTKFFMFVVVLKLCKNENTRKVHSTAYESRNQENIVLLEEVSLLLPFSAINEWI